MLRERISIRSSLGSGRLKDCLAIFLRFCCLVVHVILLRHVRLLLLYSHLLQSLHVREVTVLGLSGVRVSGQNL